MFLILFLTVPTQCINQASLHSNHNSQNLNISYSRKVNKFKEIINQVQNHTSQNLNISYSRKVGKCKQISIFIAKIEAFKQKQVGSSQ